MTQDSRPNIPSSDPNKGAPVSTANLLGCDPKKVAVVLAAHGDRGDTPLEERNQAGMAHRDRLAAGTIFQGVYFGVLKGTPTLEEALSEAVSAEPAAVVIYPFFMADGYFVKTVLRQRLAEFGLAVPHRILAPLGLDPNLVPLILRQSQQVAEKAGLSATQGRLLLVGHGSKFGTASATATRQVMQTMQQNLPAPFKETDVAFLEEAPFLADQLQSSSRPTVVSGFFNGDGLHGGQDIPKAIAEARTGAHYTGPIGAESEVSALIQRAVLEAL